MFQSRRTPHLRQTIYVGGILLLTFWIVLASLNSKTQLERIRDRGFLHIATLNSPLTFYYDRDQPAGYEYQLAKNFADYLDVELKVSTAADPKRLFELLESRKVDLLAANLINFEARNREHRPSTTYRHEKLVALYRKQQGYEPPRSLNETKGMRIEVLVDSGENDLIQSELQSTPGLKWRELTNTNRLDLMTRLQNRESELALVPASLWRTYASYHPELNIAFELQEQMPVAWYFGAGDDESLLSSSDLFLQLEQTQSLIAELESLAPPTPNPLNYFDATAFREGVEQRYSELQGFFQQAAEETGYDALFLAAVAYQESHWRADAVSPTGVRGVMMLTEDAATDVGVSDRTDPRQSILGGAQYLLRIEKKIPERIEAPDRIYLALAGYNIGFGHLEDARILTQRAGDDPDKWNDVAKHLPKLEEEAYYSTTKYGQARGNEAVTYVRNIQEYQKILPTEALLAELRTIPIIAPN